MDGVKDHYIIMRISAFELHKEFARSATKIAAALEQSNLPDGDDSEPERARKLLLPIFEHIDDLKRARDTLERKLETELKPEETATDLTKPDSKSIQAGSES